ncbi:MAG: aminotransferase class V-fold PLP-dependent enzyme [Alphaproteobacteria bacterium]
MSWKPFFARTFGRREAPLHFAPQGHHPWPDVTYDAQLNAWRDAAHLLDGKWEWIESRLAPRARKRLAGMLNLDDPDTLVFGSGIHEFLMRVLSCLPRHRPHRILTSDSEPARFDRQAARLEEEGAAVVIRVPSRPFDSFPERFRAEAAKGGHDLLWLSHVFFDSGFIVPALEDIVASVPDPAILIVFDGTHSFMAVPVDLHPIERRAFYVAGGGKYAMAGEGVSFLHVPPHPELHPRDTGGFPGGDAPVGAAGVRKLRSFGSAEADPTGLYRLTAVLEWLAERRLTVDRTTEYVRHLQILFLDQLREDPLSPVHTDQLLADPRFGQCGRFLAFNTDHADRICEGLRRQGVIVDHRRGRLRIGFGIYHTAEDVDRLVSQLRLAARFLP